VADSQNKASKAEVQSTKLNKIPFAEESDTEFSAEEAAEVFEEHTSDSSLSEHQE